MKKILTIIYEYLFVYFVIMSTEILNEMSEDLIQASLMDLKKEVEAMNPVESLPWEFKLIKKMKDEEKRNWKIYSYTLKSWGSYRQIQAEYVEKLNDPISFSPERNFCDISWNNIPKREFSKWETIYIKVPDTDVFDEVPKMTLEDITNLSDVDIRKMYNSYTSFDELSIYEHADKGWDYVMFNGKKVYIEYYYANHTRLLAGEPCFLPDFHNGNMTIWEYDWKNFNWVYCDDKGSVKRWIIEIDDGWYKKR